MEGVLLGGPHREALVVQSEMCKSAFSFVKIDTIVGAMEGQCTPKTHQNEARDKRWQTLA